MKQNTLLCFLIFLAACTSRPNENKNENIITQHDRKKLIAKATCLEDFIEIGKLMDYKPGWAHIAWKERKARISQAEWKPPARPVKYRKFNMSEIMKQAGIPEPPWGK